MVDQRVRDAEKRRMAAAQYRASHREKRRAEKALYRARHPEKKRESDKRYRNENAAKRREYNVKWRERVRGYSVPFVPREPRQLCAATPEAVRADRNAKERERYARDPQYRLIRLLRGRIYDALKGRVKRSSSTALLGCSIQDAIAHLESKFLPGMSWKNQGRYGWHIDHIVPLSILDLSDPCEMARACHYTNLQPLWASDNIRKRNRKVA